MRVPHVSNRKPSEQIIADLFERATKPIIWENPDWDIVYRSNDVDENAAELVAERCGVPVDRVWEVVDPFLSRVGG